MLGRATLSKEIYPQVIRSATRDGQSKQESYPPSYQSTDVPAYENVVLSNRDRDVGDINPDIAGDPATVWSYVDKTRPFAPSGEKNSAQQIEKARPTSTRLLNLPTWLYISYLLFAILVKVAIGFLLAATICMWAEWFTDFNDRRNPLMIWFLFPLFLGAIWIFASTMIGCWELIRIRRHHFVRISIPFDVIFAVAFTSTGLITLLCPDVPTNTNGQSISECARAYCGAGALFVVTVLRHILELWFPLYDD